MPFNLELQHTLQAAANRIIPPDEFPDAWTAGVGNYLQRQWQSDLSASVPVYEAGLNALNAEAHRQCGAAFASLTTAQQDDVLRCVEAGEVQTHWSVPPRHFFQMLVKHISEGYYGDMMSSEPISWQMLGYTERCRRA